jgi:hypothetical protein
LSGGAIAGIAIGVLCGLILIGVIVHFAQKKKESGGGSSKKKGAVSYATASFDSLLFQPILA